MGCHDVFKIQVKLQSFFRLADSPRCVIESRWDWNNMPASFSMFELQNLNRQCNHLHWNSFFLSGGLLHELFHVFGIMHEQKRTDRDRWAFYPYILALMLFELLSFRYIRVLKENIQDHYEYAYEKCPRCNNFGSWYMQENVLHMSLQTPHSTATRSCCMGPKPSHQERPPWLQLIALLVISGGNPTIQDW